MKNQDNLTEYLCNIADEMGFDTLGNDDNYLAVEEIAIEAFEKVKELARNQTTKQL